MFSPCSQGVSSTKNANRKKHAKEQNTLRPSLTKDRRFTSLGPRVLKSCPLLLGSWRKDSPGWEKAEAKFTATSGLRVRVCPVSPPYITRVCCSVSLVRIKSDNYYSLSSQLWHILSKCKTQRYILSKCKTQRYILSKCETQRHI